MSKLMNNIDHRKCAKVMIQCIVCASIQDDNPQALASGLSPAQTQKKHTITFLLHQHALALCAV